MEEFIENEFLLPALSIGISEDVFWKQSPKSIKLYFKAYQMAKEREWKETEQKAWLMGVYVKQAIATSVFAAGLYDGKHKLPDYPQCPHTNFENNSNEMSEKELEAQRLRAYAYFKSFGKHK